MSSFLYELPTTGAITFSELCAIQNGHDRYTIYISDATQARANLRASLKEAKRGEKDYLKLIVEDYLPLLGGIIASVNHDEIGLKAEPVFSWRTTLSNNLFNTSPRLDAPSLYADQSYSLLTYAYALSNLSRVISTGLGDYEFDPGISEEERRAKDEKLTFAVTLLCRASGAFEYVGETLFSQWERSSAGLPATRPVDLSREVATALSKMALADAQALSIRKLLSKASYDSVVTHSPPLPKARSLIAKLHLECVALYSSAKSLAKSVSAGGAQSISSRFGTGTGTNEVSMELRRYLTDETTLHNALAKKWMGVDAGEVGGKKGGEAVGWLVWAKSEMESLKDGGATGPGGGSVREKDLRELRKVKVKRELEDIGAFLKNYKKMNDAVSFEPVPNQADLQARIPTGKIAVASKPYTPSAPAFGPGSLSHTQASLDDMSLPAVDSGSSASPPGSGSPTVPRSYAGEGSYF
ncbi:BRO1-like domain-containing protein [Pterulicium gracile]|uniref:pH-response regulator protein palC n=1 Tax=Pterulicium gracile TaxID=1884261 RepID=A0A5C3QMN5_9AGAR|nr:BRO1-like domain-containing protein [Pterula gracilis]